MLHVDGTRDQVQEIYISGVARPGPSRARPDLIIDYHMDITVLTVESACKTAKPRQGFMFIASELAQNFASYSRASSFFDRNSPSHVRSMRLYVRGCGQKISRTQAHAYHTLGPTYSIVLSTPLIYIPAPYEFLRSKLALWLYHGRHRPKKNNQIMD